MTIKCLLTRRFWEQDLDFLRSNIKHEIEFIEPRGYTVQAMIEMASKGIDILLGDVPEAEVLDASTSVKLLQIPWTGLDQVNFDVLKKYPFEVCNSHSNATSVAEMGMALLFSCLKQIPSHHYAMQQGNWRRPGAEDCTMPEVLYGKNIGLIGYGAIGRKLAHMLLGFDVNLQALASRARQEDDITVMGDDQLDFLCSWSDIIIISVPLTPKTKDMIGKRQFEIMKSNAYLINISRGAVIDEESLYNALKSRQIACAGIDVWYRYPKRGESISRPSRFSFEDLYNVVMSPHRGGMVGGELPHLVDVVENLNRFAQGKPLINRIDLMKGY